jgi:hypothetical protein
MLGIWIFKDSISGREEYSKVKDPVFSGIVFKRKYLINAESNKIVG